MFTLQPAFSFHLCHNNIVLYLTTLNLHSTHASNVTFIYTTHVYDFIILNDFKVIHHQVLIFNTILTCYKPPTPIQLFVPSSYPQSRDQTTPASYNQIRYYYASSSVEIHYYLLRALSKRSSSDFKYVP